jgi:hypothetical protein
MNHDSRTTLEPKTPESTKSVPPYVASNGHYLTEAWS